MFRLSTDELTTPDAGQATRRREYEVTVHAHRRLSAGLALVRLSGDVVLDTDLSPTDQFEITIAGRWVRSATVAQIDHGDGRQEPGTCYLIHRSSSTRVAD